MPETIQQWWILLLRRLPQVVFLPIPACVRHLSRVSIQPETCGRRADVDARDGVGVARRSTARVAIRQRREYLLRRHLSLSRRSPLDQGGGSWGRYRRGASQRHKSVTMSLLLTMITYRHLQSLYKPSHARPSPSPRRTRRAGRLRRRSMSLSSLTSTPRAPPQSRSSACSVSGSTGSSFTSSEGRTTSATRRLRSQALPPQRRMPRLRRRRRLQRGLKGESGTCSWSLPVSRKNLDGTPRGRRRSRGWTRVLCCATR